MKFFKRVFWNSKFVKKCSKQDRLDLFFVPECRDVDTDLKLEVLSEILKYFGNLEFSRKLGVWSKTSSSREIFENKFKNGHKSLVGQGLFTKPGG